MSLRNNEYWQKEDPDTYHFRRLAWQSFADISSLLLYISALVFLWMMPGSTKPLRRNLIEYKEWSFNPGHPTAGSTSPLWTILLSGAYIFHISPLYWAYFLGGLFFIITCLLAIKIINQAYLVDKWLFTVFMLALIPLEWHLVWAAASGMETILFTCLVIFVFYLLLHKEIQPINYWVNYRSGGLGKTGRNYFDRSCRVDDYLSKL